MVDVTTLPRLLRVSEVAQATGLETWRLYALLKAGKGPPCMRIGRTIRISETAMAEWIEEQHCTNQEE